MDRSENLLTRWRTLAYGSWAVIGILALIVAAGWALGRISGALAPFVLAFLFVFLLQGLITNLETRGMSRTAAVVIAFLTAFIIVSLVVVFVFPIIGAELGSFATAIPDYLGKAQDEIEGLRTEFSKLVIPDWLSQVTDSVSGSITDVFVQLGNTLARGIVTAGGGLASAFFNLFLGAVVAFWTLKDLPKIRTELKTLAGDKYEEDLENLLATVGRVVGGYLKGQTIASLATGTLAGIGLAIAGVPYALALGVLTFILNYVPYVGPLIGGLIAASAGLFVGDEISLLRAVLAVGIVVAAQQVTDLFITPRVMSEQVDLHPILVIFSLLVGGSLFGFWGMIFAIPFAATAKGLFVYYWERRNQRTLATEDGALFRTPSCDDDSSEDCVDEPETVEGDDDEHPTSPQGSK